jgi:hypothetical protein
MPLQRLTKLEAVNTLLDAIGEAPISSLNNTGLIDAVKAETQLDDTSREVQLMGWHFNTLDNYSLAPDINGYIYIPTNAYKVDPCSVSVDYVQVGDRLYNRLDNTFVIGKTVIANLGVLREFEELPEAAKNFIKIKSARRFQEKMIGSSELSRFDREDEQRAWIELLDAELQAADNNMLRDSHTTSSVVNRQLI